MYQKKVYYNNMTSFSKNSHFMSCFLYFISYKLCLSKGGIKVNQKKIGQFLKELRKEKKLSQEQFAEIIGVSNRSVSRWETGMNMPDIDILIQISNYYNVELKEILDGQRGEETMNKQIEETALKVADYSNYEKQHITKRMHFLFIAGTCAFITYMILDIYDLCDTGIYEKIADFSLGLILGILITGVLFTSRYIAKIKAFKARILKRNLN